jgi:hypothetical protein
MCNHDQAINQFHKDYGFDPFRIYCQVTGKPFATILEEEMDSVLSLVCESNDDADAAAQDLWLRVVASMRPSLKWNKFRSNTLAELRVSDPIETLAYLVNRMFGPHNRLKGGMTLSHYEERIKAWQRIKDWGVTDETNTLTYMLLEIDAKMGLDVEMPPFNWLDFFDADSMKHRVEMTQGWYGQLMVRWEKRIKEEEMSVRWMRHGNVLAKPAFADAYQESKPLTITGIKRAEKQAEKAIFSEALFEVLGEIFDSKSMEPRPEAPAPVLVPLVRVKNPFARKES